MGRQPPPTKDFSHFAVLALTILDFSQVSGLTGTVLGAGFYVDATEPKWAANYLMYAYVTNELPGLVAGAQCLSVTTIVKQLQGRNRRV